MIFTIQNKYELRSLKAYQNICDVFEQVIMDKRVPFKIRFKFAALNIYLRFNTGVRFRALLKVCRADDKGTGKMKLLIKSVDEMIYEDFLKELDERCEEIKKIMQEDDGKGA